MPQKKENLINDLPTERDTLDFKPYVEALADACNTSETPLTIGIFGTWGSGKTSLMQMIKKTLPKKHTVVWFNAWKYDKEDSLWRALILNLLFAVRSKIKDNESTEALDYLESMLYQSFDIEKTGGVKIDLLNLGGIFTKGAVQLGLSFIPGGTLLNKFIEEVQKNGANALTDEFTQSIHRERSKIHIEQIRSLEKFEDKFKILIQSYIAPGRLVVFIDDLDRCLPEKAIEVLEAIKLFLDIPNCVFVLGIDQGVISRGVEIRYKEFSQMRDEQSNNLIDGEKYLEKIIQLPFQIPPIEIQNLGDFVGDLVKEWPAPECADVFTKGLGENPRQVKRTINTFMMLWNLSKKRGLHEIVKPIRLAKVVAIQNAAPRLYDLIRKDHIILRDIETHYLSINSNADTNNKNKNETNLINEQNKSSNVQLTQELNKLLSKTPSVKNILTLYTDIPDSNFREISYDELKTYFTLTRNTEISSSHSTNNQKALLLPQLVRVGAGAFQMGTTHEHVEELVKNNANKSWVLSETPQHQVEISEYFIGKYPVTNIQYQAFIQDTSYFAPSGWDGDQFPQGKEAHPVTYISWEDAISYCEWLSNITNKHYRLPTEAEWEKAARGTDKRKYPWGNYFSNNKANTLESKLNITSPVGDYSSQGNSPYGCSDMAGNVWEWCSDFFVEYSEILSQTKNPKVTNQGIFRVLRGGSFAFSAIDARCSTRTYLSQENKNNNCGFRVVLSPTERK